VLGIHPGTVRVWTAAGLLPCIRVGARQERRYARADLLRVQSAQATTAETPAVRRIVIYARVSGRHGQETSLDDQVRVLEAAACQARVEIVRVVREHGSGLNERRRGLARAVHCIQEHQASEIWVTHRDRVARFGVPYLEALLAQSSGRVVVLKASPVREPQEELLDDFMSLVATFSGRLYGQRSAETRRRLLAQASTRT
jgi:putative resolvase